MTTEVSFYVCHVDVHGAIKRRGILIAADQIAAIKEASEIVSPYSVELWRGQLLVERFAPGGMGVFPHREQAAA